MYLFYLAFSSLNLYSILSIIINYSEDKIPLLLIATLLLFCNIACAFRELFD